MDQVKAAPRAEHIKLGEWFRWLGGTDSIPKLEPLCAAIPGRGPIAARDLPNEVQKTAEAWADLFQTAATDYGLSLAGLEMALIADQRRQSPTAPAYFNSYISMFSSHAEALHAAYNACIYRGPGLDGSDAQDYAYQDPIVVHSDLYSPSTGYFHVTFDGEPRGVSAADRTGVLYAHGFPLRRRRGSVAKSVRRQLEDVAEILLAKARTAGVHDEISGGTLALVPFARPEFALPSTMAPVPEYHATPGGCLFFIFRDNLAKEDIKLSAFLRSVRWVLAEASAAESQTAFEAVARQRGFAAAMLHGTVTAVRAIGAPALVDLLIDQEADRKLFTVHDLITEFPGDPDEQEHKQLIVEQLQRMVFAENIASSLVGFAQVHADDGVIRPKFQCTRPWSLRGMANRTWQVTAGSSSPHQLITGGEDGGADWRLPSGYLREELVAGLIMELFRNAIEYGDAASDGKVIELSLYGSSETAIIQIANAMGRRGEAPAGMGFVSRVKALMQEIPGLDLWTGRSDDGSKFVARLTLAELATSREDDDEEPTLEPSRPQKLETAP